MRPKVWRDATWKPGVLGHSGGTELPVLQVHKQQAIPGSVEEREQWGSGLGQVAGFQAVAFLSIGMASGEMTHSWSSAKNGWPCVNQAFLSNKMVSVLWSLVDKRCFIL